MSNSGMFLRENSGTIIFVLCMLACALYCLICMRCRRNRVDDRPPPPQATAIAMSAANGAAAANDAGLSQLAIDALPIFPYRAEGKGENDRAAATTHCAVCLSLVGEGETVRLLPECGHAFHVECIDLWLRSHSLCPLCRAEAKPPSAAEKPRRDPGVPLPMV